MSYIFPGHKDIVAAAAAALIDSTMAMTRSRSDTRISKVYREKAGTLVNCSIFSGSFFLNFPVHPRVISLFSSLRSLPVKYPASASSIEGFLRFRRHFPLLGFPSRRLSRQSNFHRDILTFRTITWDLTKILISLCVYSLSWIQEGKARRKLRQARDKATTIQHCKKHRRKKREKEIEWMKDKKEKMKIRDMRWYKVWEATGDRTREQERE